VADEDADVELDEERRRYVLDVFAKLDSLDHYALLGIARDADKADVKRAYFRLARFIHPDRYFGKKLGSYRPKLEAIFTRMTGAHEILGDVEKRKAYDATLSAAPMTAQGSTPAPVDPEVAARRKAALEGLSKQLALGKAKAKDLAAAAERAFAAGDVTTAAAGLRDAARLAPDDAALRARAEEVQRFAVVRACEASRRQALLEEKHGLWAQAIASWRRVLSALPDDAEARTHLAAAEQRSK
jgi:curved DNA-binding protein CbpA